MKTKLNYQFISGWFAGSVYELEYEYTDRRVHPYTLKKDGAEISVAEEDAIGVLDELIERAYQREEGTEPFDTEWRQDDDRQRSRDINTEIMLHTLKALG